MGHLLILTWINVHNNQNTFFCFRFFKLSTFWPQNICEFFFEKVDIFNNPSGIRTYICRFIVYALTVCATLLGNNLDKKKILRLNLILFVFFDRKFVPIWRCPLPHFRPLVLSLRCYDFDYMNFWKEVCTSSVYLPS